MTTKAQLLGRPRFLAGVEASARHLPWVLLLTSLEGFRDGAPPVVRALEFVGIICPVITFTLISFIRKNF